MPAHRTSAARRSYRLGRRQATIDLTRERIVAAAFELHATVGPSRTSISAIASRAGVQRHTVYSHFASIDALYDACTTHGMTSMGMPTGASWPAIADPVERLRTGLTELTAWHRANASALQVIVSDVDPAAPPPASADPFMVRMTDLRSELARGWEVREVDRLPFQAVLEHAMAFATWHSLSGGGLTDRAAVELLVGIVQRVADGSIVPGRRG
jgi:AcrR family transcriptional regulator